MVYHEWNQNSNDNVDHSLYEFQALQFLWSVEIVLTFISRVEDSSSFLYNICNDHHFLKSKIYFVETELLFFELKKGILQDFI